MDEGRIVDVSGMTRTLGGTEPQSWRVSVDFPLYARFPQYGSVFVMTPDELDTHDAQVRRKTLLDAAAEISLGEFFDNRPDQFWAEAAAEAWLRRRADETRGE